MSAPNARVSALSLRNFRNFERLELGVPDAGLALIGDNGHGKTNLLEAAYYVSLLRSARGARDSDLVRFGTEGFFIDARLCAPDSHEIAIGFERGSRTKRVRKDGAVQDRLSDAIGTLPIVMFSPFDVELVAGAPSERRRFLDIMLSLSSRGYLASLQLYRAALDRRNAAIRDAIRHPERTSAVEVWEAPMTEHGARLIRIRRSWAMQIAERFSERCAAIGERASAEVRYECSVNANAESLEGELATAFAAKRQSDLRLGLTQVGPHRDDLLLLLGGHEMRVFGSAGQQRTAAIALRTLEAETLREARAASPVFLLDDPFAELDAKRAARVLTLLREIGLGQTILAVPRPTDVPEELTELERRTIVNGAIS